MIKYLECQLFNDEHILIKMDSIREVQEIVSPGDCCKINGIYFVRKTYEEVKAIINGDDRRVIYDDKLDFRLKQIIRDGIMDLYKRLGNERTIEYLKEVLS